MTEINRDKLIDKVRKCLALGTSSNEHEAAAALRQAQKLMAAHNITEEDVGISQYVNEQVITDYEFGRKKPIVVSSVVGLVCSAIGVEAMWELGFRKGKAVHAVRFFGRKDKVSIAKYAFDVSWRAVTKSWRDYSKANPHVKKRQGGRAGFYIGWCQTVRSKIEDLRPQGDEAAAIDKSRRKHYNMEPDQEFTPGKSGTTKINRETTAAGLDAGESFSIHKPINTGA